MTDELCGVGINFTPADSQVKIWTDTDVVSLDDAPEQIEDTWVIRFTPRKTGSFTIYAESGSRRKSQTINISPVVSSVLIEGNSDPLEQGSAKIKDVYAQAMQN